MRVPPELVLPVFVSVIFFIALLIGYPWQILWAGSVLYLASLPMGWKSYRDEKRAYDAAKAPAPAAAAAAAPTQPVAPPVAEAPPDDRPDRLH
jgi:CDP-diacylglycerol--serine O-phosphatidyltransferase